MLGERGTDGGILGLEIGRPDALESPMMRERLGGDIGTNTGLIVVVLVTLAAVQHLGSCQYFVFLDILLDIDSRERS